MMRLLVAGLAANRRAAAVLALSACLVVSACSGNVVVAPAGEGGGGEGGSGGDGGSGDSAPLTSLPPTGTVDNGCVEYYKHAIEVRIGVEASCDAFADQPFVTFRPYNTLLEGLAAGDGWVYPSGDSSKLLVVWSSGQASTSGPEVASASLSLVEMNEEEATFEYAFETMEGTVFEGTATVRVCGSIEGNVYCN